jgi:hypothetical protein
MSIRRALRCSLSAIGAVLLVSTAAVRPLAAQQPTLSVTVSSFLTPAATDFTAGFISASATYTVGGCTLIPCTVKIVAVNSSVTEPACGCSAVTVVQVSTNGVSGPWTTVGTSGVTLNSSIASGTGSFLLRYQLGWQSGSNPYTPPGTYTLPIKFTLSVNF